MLHKKNLHRFILIRGIRFFVYYNLGMFPEEIFIVKTDGTDDTQVVCDNANFISITKMTIYIELFDIRIGRGMSGHGAVSGFIRVITVVKVHGFIKAGGEYERNLKKKISNYWRSWNSHCVKRNISICNL